MPQPSIEVAFESEISPGLFSSFFYSVCCCTNLSLASCFSCHFHFKIGKSLRYIRPNGRTSERIAPKAIVERYSVCYCANTWMRSFGVCITLHTNTFYHQTEWGGGGGDYFVKCIPSDSILFSIMSMTVSEPAHVYVCLCCGTATALVFNAKRESFRGSTSQKFMWNICLVWLELTLFRLFFYSFISSLSLSSIRCAYIRYLTHFMSSSTTVNCLVFSQL